MHRGAIEVKSKVGEGTSFFVKLPASPSIRPWEEPGEKEAESSLQRIGEERGGTRNE
jgi:hypothetical protein